MSDGERIRPDCEEVTIYGSGEPVRLFVAGLHGNEWRDTSHLLLDLEPPEKGTLAIIPQIDRGEYLSTLEDNYYIDIGYRIIEAVEMLKPDIYLELHSYYAGNRMNLTDKDRIDKTGVPAYSYIDEGMLLGSVAPYIRKNYFPMEALCVSFEIQKSCERSRVFAKKMLDIFKEFTSRDDFINFLNKNYPVQAKKAIENYKRFYGL